MIARYLESVLFSTLCAGCEAELTAGENKVCFSCLASIRQTHFHTVFRDNELFYRLAGKVRLEGAVSMYYYEKGGRLQLILERLKYKQSPDLGNYLGALYGQVLQGSEFLEGVQCLIPVPLHNKKLISRGYNQAEQIALGMSKVLGLPLRTDLLQRKQSATSQTRKSGSERWDNVSGAFKVSGILPGELVLVDDVITTGATLEACIRVLHEQDSTLKIKIASIGMAKRD